VVVAGLTVFIFLATFRQATLYLFYSGLATSYIGPHQAGTFDASEGLGRFFDLLVAISTEMLGLQTEIAQAGTS
jgi:hypothetical protein